MADAPQAKKDEEFVGKLEKFVDSFPTTEDYEGITEYVSAINEGEGSDDDIKDLRESALADLEELEETLEKTKDKLEELLKFSRENFK